jgi:2,4-dienoyl-CoA reductase-like NADH-dependent reductase (Old Yellow Enzyme family)/thioredoxin reductase
MNISISDPIEINGMRLKNRIALAPMLNNPAGEGGRVSDKTIAWYEARAKGGAGLIMTGLVIPTAWVWKILPSGLALFDDSYIPGYARLVEAVHTHGSRLAVQMGFLGPLTGIGASPKPYPDETHPRPTVQEILDNRTIPVEELSVEQIAKLIADCGKAAARLKKAGVDCIELHCAHGGATLHGSFLSPFYNRRNDKYGGNWEKRMRLVKETLTAIRKAVGNNYPIIARISADEFLGKWGITLEDTIKIILPALEKTGVDCFDVSQGSVTHTSEGIEPPLYYKRGCFIHLAEAVKKNTRLPVISVGRILDLDMAERFLQEGKADIISMLRQLIVDPETPQKYFKGNHEEIRKCIGCLSNTRCRPCSINYETLEAPVPLVPAGKSRKVLVIGGGVAGMEAARIAALRGHQVTLIEKETELGGTVGALALNPLTAEFKNIVAYLATQMKRLDVEVILHQEAKARDAENSNPDVVILATGATVVRPQVTKGKQGIVTHMEALKNKRAVGMKVVVWGFFGAELAIYLAEEGREVILIGKGGTGSLASDLQGARRLWILRKLTDLDFVRETPAAARLSNPSVIYNVDVEKITPSIVGLADKAGNRTELLYDTLILSRRFGENKRNDALFKELRGKVPEIYKIGDCFKVRGIKEAIWTANEVARKI